MSNSRHTDVRAKVDESVIQTTMFEAGAKRRQLCYEVNSREREIITMSDRHTIEQVIISPDADAVDCETTYCVGCGSCSYLDPAFRIVKTLDGSYRAEIAGKVRDWDVVEEACPFAASMNEDQLGQELFGMQSGVLHNEYLGYYLNTWVGYAQSGGWRDRGSSGGMVSWLAAKMLEEGLVDAVIHAKDGPDSEHMYTIQISHTLDELKTGAKSKYYPVEMSDALQYVREHDARYLFIGIPCFVKAVRLLCRQDDLLKRRIPYCIGLVCGHLKSDFFAKSEAWESGVPLDEVARVDFRYKTPGTPASDYAVEVRRSDGKEPVIKRTAELSTTNWGLGYFKYNSCDYCDDVLAETADVTFGDAWIPKYVSDGAGCNVVVVRNQVIADLLERHSDELVLHESNADEVYQSQAGGFRHRRQGLAYRLYVHKKRGEWTPTKRVQPSLEGISERRQHIYAMRTELKNESFVAYRKAVDGGNFRLLIRHMKPIERRYDRLVNKPSVRLRRDIKKMIKKIVPKSVISYMKAKVSK